MPGVTAGSFVTDRELLRHWVLGFISSQQNSQSQGILCTIHMTESCASLLVLYYKEGYIETIIFIFPRQTVFIALYFSASRLHTHLPLAQKPFFSHSPLFFCLWSYTSQLTVSVPIPWSLTQHYLSNWYWSEPLQSEIPRTSVNVKVTIILTGVCLTTVRKQNPLRLTKSSRLN